MADILLFPARRASAVAHQHDALQPKTVMLAAVSNVDAWSKDDTADNDDLELVASLAAAPS